MLFCNIDLLDDGFRYKKNMFVGVKDGRIAVITDKKPSESFGEEYDGKGKLLMSGLYNAHSHAAMSLLRGRGENLSLSDWLNKRIFPFEARLTKEDIYNGTLLSIAEMLRFGVVSFTDMYYEGADVARAVIDSGIKCNFSCGTTTFDDTDYIDLPRYKENEMLISEYHNQGDGRFLVDFSVHAEYTNKEKIVRATAERAKYHGVNMHVHLSETEAEHRECIERHKKTPAEFFLDCGVFENPTTAAHCVWVTEKDLDIFKENGVTVATCPVSNLKLGTGVANVPLMLEKGVNVALGTDGSASNNNLNMFKDLYLLSLLSKGIYHNPTLVSTSQALKIATVNGAFSQGRTDCGAIKTGNKADLILLEENTEHTVPVNDALSNVIFASEGSDVVLTMVDGKVLYKNGEYTTLDIEKAKYNATKSTQRIAGEIGD